MSKSNGHDASHGYQSYEKLDALVVGGGFSGVYQLHCLRQEGFSVKLVESGSDFGGAWYWNRYPGARVDSATPHYEYSDPLLWKDWKWRQRFPGSEELRQYFSYVAEKWDLRRDALFETTIEKAIWEESEKKWTVACSNGRVFHVRYLLLNLGYTTERYTPNWQGLQTFKGTWLTPSLWPSDEPEVEGKKVAIIGTGATAVSIIQEYAKKTQSLVVFQRTPAFALPMRQEHYDGEKQNLEKSAYPHVFGRRRESFAGFDFTFMARKTFDDDPEQRQETFQSLWNRGDFHFWLASYADTLFDKAANVEAYNFWRDQTRQRINDARIRDLLAPMNPPFSFGTKRMPLEIDYYDLFNNPNVELVDLNTTPIVRITDQGIQTSEKEWAFDHIVCATGFNSLTGGYNLIDIQGRNGQKLRDKWADGLATYLGMSVEAFPNMFYAYGPHAPTALCNGPTCVELQGEWLVTILKDMRTREKITIEAKPESEEEWKETITSIANSTLLPGTNSWYMGANIPGKKREPLAYFGGVPKYCQTLEDCANAGYSGFEIH